MTTVDQPPVVLPADWVPGPEQGFWTYDDYAALPDDGQRYEIVNGVLVMSPSPDGPHQDAVARFTYHLLAHIEFSGLGKVRVAPFDVELAPEDVFQPDVLVVLNAHLDRVKEKKIVGAPDLVIEVASDSTAAYDRIIKHEKYAKAGVPEFWIANAKTRTVQVSVLESGRYRSLGVFHGLQTLPSHVLPDLPVSGEQFFA